MCTDQFGRCPWCHYEKHLHWAHCRSYLINLLRSIQAVVEPLPKPDDCPYLQRRLKMYLGILTCPIEECKTTMLVPARLAEIAQELAQKRAWKAKMAAQEEAERQAFAAQWFNRLRVPALPTGGRRSLLTEGIRAIESIPHKLVYRDRSTRHMRRQPDERYDIGHAWERGTWFSWTTQTFPDPETRFN